MRQSRTVKFPSYFEHDLGSRKDMVLFFRDQVYHWMLRAGV